MYKIKPKIFIRDLLLASFMFAFLAQIALPMLQQTASAAPLQPESNSVSLFDGTEMDDRVKIRNLAIVFDRCYIDDNKVSAEEVSNGRWLASGSGTDPEKVIGKIVEPTDGVVDCAGEDGNWIYQLFVDQAKYASLEEAFNAVAIPKPADDTDPIGRLKSKDEIKSILNARFGTDIFSLNDRDYLTYRSNYWSFINLCGATEVSSASSVGLTKPIFIINNNVVTSQLYSYNNETVANGIGYDQGRLGDVKCSTIAEYLADKSHADAFLVAAKAQAETTGKDLEEIAGGVGDGPDGGTENSIGDSCLDALPFFGWITCWVIDAADGIYKTVQSQVAKILIIDTNNLDSLRSSWAAVKNLANALLVFVALAMIAAQIFNLEVFSAYTVKKIIPRLIIAAIAIQLSWYICILAIDFFNVLGAGLYNLLVWPFTHTPGNTGGTITGLFTELSGAQQFGSSLLTAFGLTTAIVTTGIIGLQLGGWMTLLMALLGVIVSILVAFFSIIIRGMLITISIALAPIAIVAWILPGTQNLWKLWYELFSKLLMMFPLIMLLFAAGTIGANLLAAQLKGQQGTEAMFTIIMMLIVYFAPLFLIPSTFKFAGKTFGSINGAINKLGDTGKKSGFGLRRRRDAYRKVADESRGQALAKNIEERRGGLYDPKAKGFRAKVNNARARATMGPEGLIPHRAGKWGEDAKSRLEQDRLRNRGAIEKAEIEEAQRIWSGVSSNIGDDYNLRTQVVKQITLDTPIGETANILGQEVTVSAALKRVAYELAASDKNIGVLDGAKAKYFRDVVQRDAAGNERFGEEDGLPTKMVLGAQEGSEAEAEALTKALGAQFGTVAPYAPDLAKSAILGESYTVSGGKPQRGGMFANRQDNLKSFGALKGGDFTPEMKRERRDTLTRHGFKESSDIQQRQITIVEDLRERLASAESADQQAAIQEIHTIAQSGTLSDNADAAAYLGSLLDGVVGEYIRSGGNKQLVAGGASGVRLASTTMAPETLSTPPGGP